MKIKTTIGSFTHNPKTYTYDEVKANGGVYKLKDYVTNNRLVSIIHNRIKVGTVLFVNDTKCEPILSSLWDDKEFVLTDEKITVEFSN